jgi:predicted ester cyclase
MPQPERDAVLTAVRRIPLEVFAQGRLDVLDEVLAPDYVDHSFPPGMPQGAAGIREVVSQVRAGMPDLEVTVDIELKDGDFVVQHTHGHGTNTGPAFGGLPTGRRAVWAETHIYRTRGCLVVEHWGVVKLDSIWRQLGLVEIPSAAAQSASAPTPANT